MALLGAIAFVASPRPPAEAAEGPAKPVVLVVSKERAKPGAALALTYGGDDLQAFVRGIEARLQRRERARWRTTHYLIAAFHNGQPASYPVTQPLAVVDIGIIGPGPDRVRLPQLLKAGRYRICTEMIRVPTGAAAGLPVDQRRFTACAPLTIRR